jgi:hypothetical protein
MATEASVSAVAAQAWQSAASEVVCSQTFRVGDFSAGLDAIMGFGLGLLLCSESLIGEINVPQ